MAVAHDASSESHTGTTVSASEASFSWTHTPSGTPKGVLVFTYQMLSADTTDRVSAVTYGGTSMTAVAGGRATDSAGEPGDCKAWFLGSSVPTGAQSVVVTRTNDTTAIYATCATVTASTNTDTAGVQAFDEDNVLVEVAVNDGSPGSNSLRYAGAYFGWGDPPAAGANSTFLVGVDVGGRTASMCRETTAGQGARSVGFADANSDDRAYVALAVIESGSGDASPPVFAVTLNPITFPIPTVKGDANRFPAAGTVTVSLPLAGLLFDWVQKLQPVEVMSVFPIPNAGATGDGANEMMMMGLGV